MLMLRRKSFLFSMFGGAAALSAAIFKRQPPTPKAEPAARTAEALVDRIIEHTNAVYFVGAAYIGDRLGLFKAMAGQAVSATQLAAKTGLNERYVLEWLRAVAAAGYVKYRPETGNFEIPPEHVPVLIDEESPLFSAGLIEGCVPDILMASRVLKCFRTGEGVPYGDYPAETFESIERVTKPDYLHRLTRIWIPSIDGVVEKLRGGGAAADLGSGGGHASIAIARAFPKARVFGFEPYAPSVERARRTATAAGLGGRITFETFDGIHVPGGPYDLVTISHSLHHAGDPVALLRSTRALLGAGGALLVVEERRSARLEEDIGSPRGGYYGIGLLECLPTEIAEGGPGYGTGITEPDMRRLAASAGFRDVRRIMPDDPMLSFFVLRG